MLRTDVVEGVLRNAINNKNPALMDDNSIICHECLEDDFHEILHATCTNTNGGYNLQATLDQERYKKRFCESCGRVIGTITNN